MHVHRESVRGVLALGDRMRNLPGLQRGGVKHDFAGVAHAASIFQDLLELLSSRSAGRISRKSPPLAAATCALSDWRASSAVSCVGMLQSRFMNAGLAARRTPLMPILGLALRWPSRAGPGGWARTCAGRSCSTSRPNAQMPKQTRVSFSDGVYSTISPERRGNEPGNDQAHALFNPDADDAHHTGHVQPFQTAADAAAPARPSR